MRQFYEEWSPYVNRQPMADDLDVNGEGLLIAIRQPMAGDIDWSEFISLGFTHHIEILSKTKEISERLFYIHECAVRAWDKYTLREYIKSGLYHKKGNLTNNFTDALSDTQFAVKATKAFKDNYLLDFINTENLGETSEDIDERIIENQIVNNIKEFIVRFGTDFIFMGNQYRIEVAGEEMFSEHLRTLLPEQAEAGGRFAECRCYRGTGKQSGGYGDRDALPKGRWMVMRMVRGFYNEQNNTDKVIHYDDNHIICMDCGKWEQGLRTTLNYQGRWMNRWSM